MMLIHVLIRANCTCIPNVSELHFSNLDKVLDYLRNNVFEGLMQLLGNFNIHDVHVTFDMCVDIGCEIAPLCELHLLTATAQLSLQALYLVIGFLKPID